MSAKIRILGAHDVRRCCTMPQAIDLMKVAFSKLAAGEANVPVRTNLPVTAETQAHAIQVRWERGSGSGRGGFRVESGAASPGMEG